MLAEGIRAIAEVAEDLDEALLRGGASEQAA